MIMLATEHRTCVDETTRGPSDAVKLLWLPLQMTASVGVLILLLAAQAFILFWNGCAWGTRSLSCRLIPAGRSGFAVMNSCWRVVYLSYLGIAASWSSAQAAGSILPERAFVGAAVHAPSSGVRRTLLEFDGTALIQENDS